MNQLQATPDFIDKVSNLKWSAGRPSIMSQLQATPDFDDKVSKLEGFASRLTLNYEAATSYT